VRPHGWLNSPESIVARGWSEEKKRAYRLADNELAARASWDSARPSHPIFVLFSIAYQIASVPIGTFRWYI
jgi:hypothetical protein